MQARPRTASSGPVRPALDQPALRDHPELPEVLWLSRFVRSQGVGRARIVTRISTPVGARGRLRRVLEASFETRPAGAPQDEGGGWKRRCESACLGPHSPHAEEPAKRASEARGRLQKAPDPP